MTRAVLAGYGKFGRLYASRAELAGIEIAGVVELADVHETVRADGLRPFDKLGEAIDTTHPSLVIIATTPNAHALLAIEALQRYVDVMLAKPGALDLDEAERVATTAWSHNRRIIVDYTPTMSTNWRNLASRTWPDGILSVRLTRRSVSPFRPYGILWDLAPHDVALALELDPDDEVDHVDATAWWYPAYDEPVGAFINIAHKSCRTSRIELDWMAARDERRVEVVEHERMHVWEETTDSLGWTRRGYRCDDKGQVKGIWDLDLVTTPSLDDGRDNITRALQRARGDADDSRRYLAVIKVIEAAERSIMSKPVPDWV